MADVVETPEAGPEYTPTSVVGVARCGGVEYAYAMIFLPGELRRGVDVVRRYESVPQAMARLEGEGWRVISVVHETAAQNDWATIYLRREVPCGD